MRCRECGRDLDCEDIVANLNTWGIAKGVCSDCVPVLDERERRFKVQVKW